MAASPLAALSASALQRMLLKKEISPTHVAETCLARIDALNPTLNAIVTINERLLEEAAELERQGPQGLLYGVPVGIKDTIEVRGLRTTYGSPLLSDNIPTRDALLVKRLRRHGALIVGKTNVPEFAVGGTTSNTVFGPTRNPWDTRLTPGGSTGGGAVALASGMIALSDGTDLGGSLRMPAAFCGIVGLRPQPGVVPSADVWGRLSVAGGMGRKAEDILLFITAVAARSSDTPRAFDAKRSIRKLQSDMLPEAKIAYCADVAGIGIDPSIERVCRKAALALPAADEVDMDLSDGRRAFAVLRGYHLLAQHHELLRNVDNLGENLAGNLRSALKMSATEFAAAEHVRSTICECFREFFRTYSFLLTPCMTVQPFPVELDYPREVAGRAMQSYFDWFAPTSVLSLTGLPVACVPCGQDTNGLPVGIQIVGKSEDRVLALAARIQELFPVGLPDI